MPAMNPHALRGKGTYPFCPAGLNLSVGKFAGTQRSTIFRPPLLLPFNGRAKRAAKYVFYRSDNPAMVELTWQFLFVSVDSAVGNNSVRRRLPQLVPAA